jgi:flagellar export protein FliJ
VKKFVWRLQRLLDIKIKHENSIRAELVAVTERAVAVRSLIMVQKAALRQQLNELAEKIAKERLNEQEFFFKYVHVLDEKIKRLEMNLEELERLRQEKVKEILKVRKFRKGLEKLRQKARTEFRKEQNRYEQNKLDERTTVSYARDIIQHM